MLIREAIADPTPKPNELLGLAEFLAGRANDTNAQKQISQAAFIDIAQSLGINITPQSLAQLTQQSPLDSVLEPLAPDSPDAPLVFKGGESEQVEMPVNKAQDIVANAAKKAAKKDRGI